MYVSNFWTTVLLLLPTAWIIFLLLWARWQFLTRRDWVRLSHEEGFATGNFTCFVLDDEGKRELRIGSRIRVRGSYADRVYSNAANAVAAEQTQFEI